MLKSYSIKTSSYLLAILLVISFFTRFLFIHLPSSYIFDEIYHLPAIRTLVQNQPLEPSSTQDWLHPPLAKLFQAVSISLFGDHSLAWRFPSAIFGILAIAALYYFSLTLFNHRPTALLAAALFSFDGLQLTMSRIAMNDIFVTTWVILALTFFYRYLTFRRSQQLVFASIFTGFALATKHSALLLYPIYFLFLIYPKDSVKNQPRQLLKKIFLPTFILLSIPLLIYLLSYYQFFLYHSLKDFFHLQLQIFQYQTTLTATHTYQSSAWQWPLLIRPVWFYVKHQGTTTANIYNLGNPALFWGGFLAIIYILLKKLYSKRPIVYTLICYFFLFLPWLFSPRIMFFHHCLPALPFLCLLLTKALLNLNNKHLTVFFLSLTIVFFLFFYPLNIGLPLPSSLLKYWFWLPTWR